MTSRLGAFPILGADERIDAAVMFPANALSLLLVVVVLGLLSILLTGLLPWWLAIPLMAALGIILGLSARDW